MPAETNMKMTGARAIESDPTGRHAKRCQVPIPLGFNSQPRFLSGTRSGWHSADLLKQAQHVTLLPILSHFAVLKTADTNGDHLDLLSSGWCSHEVSGVCPPKTQAPGVAVAFAKNVLKCALEVRESSEN